MDIYKDIANRTNGEIYIGVVGPVRTGKSTFIKRFMDLCVIPYMEEGHIKERTIDELPQSAQGKTIMTTEPKFIPQNGVEIRVDENTKVKVRLVDCVGFVVEGANGHMEGEGQRMVRTPWFADEIPFEEAAKIGTKKVIQDHATIGIVVTTDGSFGEIDRASYIEAEERTIAHMEETGKPYAILLNSERPHSSECQALVTELEEKYRRPVVSINCKQMQKSDVIRLLESVLLEFPISTVEFYVPKWIEMLEPNQEMKKRIIQFAIKWMENITKMRDLYTENQMSGPDLADAICRPYIRKIRTEDGAVELRLEVDDQYYYKYLSEVIGFPITSEYQLIHMIQELAEKRKEYEKVEQAIESVHGKGYGVVTPNLEDISMEEPVLIAHAGKFGVKIRANSPSIHMIKANIETEIAPIVGSREQAEDLITYINRGGDNAQALWSANIFGKSLGELMEDGIREKISKMDEECQIQLQNTMQKVVNDNRGGLVCIIL